MKKKEVDEFRKEKFKNTREDKQQWRTVLLPHSSWTAAIQSGRCISGLRGTFCGSAAVVGGSGDECGRFVVADTAIYSV